MSRKKKRNVGDDAGHAQHHEQNPRPGQELKAPKFVERGVVTATVTANVIVIMTVEYISAVKMTRTETAIETVTKKSLSIASVGPGMLAMDGMGKRLNLRILNMRKTRAG